MLRMAEASTGSRPSRFERAKSRISNGHIENRYLNLKPRKMKNEIYNQEPNLIAEAYRNQANTYTIPRRIERHFDFIDISADGLLLLGTSNLGGRIWSGSVWVLEDYPREPDTESCLAGREFESSIASGLWLNNKNVIIGCDSGSLHHLSMNEMEDRKKSYFFTESIATEHDDSIVSLDLLNNKTKILSGGMDMNIKVWDVETLVSEKSYCPAHGHIVTSVSTMAESSDVFASTSLDGTSLIWDMREKKPASLLIGNESGFTSSVWLDEHCVCVGANNGSVSLVDLRTKSDIDKKIPSKRPIFKFSYNKESQLIAVCADDPYVQVFSCNGRKLTKVYESDEHKDFVRGLAWEPSSNTLYSCGWDSKIFSHKVTDVEEVKENKAENFVNEE